MPSLEISRMPNLAGADLQSSDPVVVADLSASESKKLTVKNLVQYGAALVDAASIPSDRITSPLPANYVATTSIQDRATTSIKIAIGTIVSTNIAADGLAEANYAGGSVSTRAIATAAVTGGTGSIAQSTITAYNIANDAIILDAMADDSVGTSNIVDGSITTAKYAALSINTAALSNLSVTDDKLANTTITYAKTNFSANDMPGSIITDDTITAAKIVANAITSSELADNSVDTAAIIAGNVTGGTGGSLASATITALNIANDAVVLAAMADDSVTTANIIDASITTAKYAALSINTAALSNLSVTDDKLANTTITYAKTNFSANDMPGSVITDDTITTAKIVANAITASELADDSVDTAAIVAGNVTGGTGGSLASSTITSLNIANDSIVLAAMADDSVTTANIIDASITTAKYASASIDTAALSNLSVTNDKIANTTIAYAKTNFSANDMPGSVITDDTITSAKIVANAITSSELADDSVDNAAIIASAVTGGATGSIAAATITDANLVASTLTSRVHSIGSIENGALATDSVSTIKVQDLSITEAKLSPFTGSNKLVAGTVTATELSSASVTTLKLALSAVDADRIAAGAVTDAKIATGVAGTKITADTLPGSSINPASLDRGLSRVSGLIGITNSITTGTKNGITYTDQGLISGVADLLPGDIPLATATDIGGVIVPTSGGMSIALDGSLSITNTLTAATVSGITFDAHGSISAAVALVGTDLPVANSTDLGAVSIPAEGLVITGAGALSLDTVGSVGSHTKCTVDTYGRVTSGAALVSTDIPDLDTAKITTGTLPTARYATRSVTQLKLADYSVSFIQEDIPVPDPGGNDYHIGMLHYQESTGQLNMWNGNSWFPVARGALAKENLRWGGTINANTGVVTTLTDAGLAAGITLSTLPAASDANGGVYFVVDTAGSSIDVDNVRSASWGVGDWCISVDSSTGWIRLDYAAGGGGGSGGASFLDQLNDVTISSPAQDQFLQYNSTSGQWENGMPILYTALQVGDIVQYYGGQLTYATEVSGGTYG